MEKLEISSLFTILSFDKIGTYMKMFTMKGYWLASEKELFGMLSIIDINTL